MCVSDCSVIMSAVRLPPRAARLSSGIPSRYLSVSMPCASGEKTMQPMPSRSSTSSRSSSIQRFSSECDGWWMSSGVPMSR